MMKLLAVLCLLLCSTESNAGWFKRKHQSRCTQVGTCVGGVCGAPRGPQDQPPPTTPTISKVKVGDIIIIDGWAQRVEPKVGAEIWMDGDNRWRSHPRYYVNTEMEGIYLGDWRVRITRATPNYEKPPKPQPPKAQNTNVPPVRAPGYLEKP